MLSRLIPRGRGSARWRRAVALFGTVVVLGIVLLDAHAALPEHHHLNGSETLCFASLAVATLTIAAWGLGSRKRCFRWLRVVSVPQTVPLICRPVQPGALARAGPAPPVVPRR